jgi:hypothetical protein
VVGSTAVMVGLAPSRALERVMWLRVVSGL